MKLKNIVGKGLKLAGGVGIYDELSGNAKNRRQQRELGREQRTDIQANRAEVAAAKTEREQAKIKANKKLASTIKRSRRRNIGLGTNAASGNAVSSTLG